MTTTEWAEATAQLWRLSVEVQEWANTYRGPAHPEHQQLEVAALHALFAAQATTPQLRRWHAANAATMVGRVDGGELLEFIGADLQRAADGAGAAVP